jgi:hypothetical protein
MKRYVSWLLAVAALVGPPLWAHYEVAAVYGQAEAEGRYVCGLPAMATMMLASFGSVILSGAAVIVGWLTFRGVPAPRPTRRAFEVAVLAVPMILGLAFLALVIVGG